MFAPDTMTAVVRDGEAISAGGHGRDARRAGALRDQVFVPRQVANRRAQLALADDRHPPDERLHHRERDVVRVHVAGQAVGNRRADLHLDDAAGGEGRGERMATPRPRRRRPRPRAGRRGPRSRFPRAVRRRRPARRSDRRAGGPRSPRARWCRSRTAGPDGCTARGYCAPFRRRTAWRVARNPRRSPRRRAGPRRGAESRRAWPPAPFAA